MAESSLFLSLFVVALDAGFVVYEVIVFLRYILKVFRMLVSVTEKVGEKIARNVFIFFTRLRVRDTG